MISGKELSTTSAPCFVQEVKSTQFLLLGLTFTPFRRESICTCMLNTAQREEEKETYESFLYQNVSKTGSAVPIFLFFIVCFILMGWGFLC